MRSKASASALEAFAPEFLADHPWSREHAMQFLLEVDPAAWPFRQRTVRRRPHPKRDDSWMAMAHWGGGFAGGQDKCQKSTDGHRLVGFCHPLVGDEQE